MIKGIYTASSGMLVNELKNEVVANNLANVNTTGYKKDITAFKSFSDLMLSRINDYEIKMGHFNIDKTPAVGKLGTCVILDEIKTDLSMGGIVETHNPLDLAVDNKDAFFVVENEGEYFFTKAGKFAINFNGDLVDHNGNKVLVETEPILSTQDDVLIDKNKNPMLGVTTFNLPAGDELFIDKDGSLSNKATNERYGVRIAFAKFEDNNLKKAGNNLYVMVENKDVKGIRNVNVNRGFIESSNVNAVTEMVSLINVQRSYEANQKVITTADNTLGQVIQQVARPV
jgi:flagellar basal-body rod protein FlgG